MRLIVCVKQVLDPRGIVVNRKAEKVFVNREEYILDPGSKAALQAAALVKERVAASNGTAPPEIVAISLGPDRVDDGLREAMALGADRAIHLKDAPFDTADALVVANALAAAVNKIGAFDLILLGARSLDSGSGELAPRLAEALDLPQRLGVISITEIEGRLIHVGCWLDGLVTAHASVKTPALLSVIPDAVEPAYANGWRLMDAYQKWTVEVWNASDLDLSTDALRPMTAKKEDAFPPERQLGRIVKDVDELVSLLKRERAIRLFDYL